ncbi:30S ribosomal protein S6 [Candidatus Saccharibacteria bacterium]|nr:MAG: 30S ribosomal protein S6 [Candidatus Saccharibacteria bacterium]
MREYELTVLFQPDLEVNLEPALKKVRDIITSNKGNITSEDNWGKKKLAYRIAREDFAIYVYFEVELPALAAGKIDQTLNITDEVIRHLLVSVDTKAKAALEAAKAEKTESEESKVEE